MEPRLIGTFDLPVDNRVIEARQGVEKRRSRFLSNVWKRCDLAQGAELSSIFLGIRRGVEHLQSLGCGEDNACYLYVSTDGEENANTQIKSALDRSADERPLPAPIRNNGIHVVICGVAETVGLQQRNAGYTRQLTRRRDPQRADRLREVWLALFAKPDLVRLEPYCQKGVGADEAIKTGTVVSMPAAPGNITSRAAGAQR
ncbi:MAG: hypothetical protein JSU00_25780 [Acidobacteria bacterium]|nr:hypothetical protein [Acidobacteriota bacterium]